MFGKSPSSDAKRGDANRGDAKQNDAKRDNAPVVLAQERKFEPLRLPKWPSSRGADNPFYLQALDHLENEITKKIAIKPLVKIVINYVIYCDEPAARSYAWTAFPGEDYSIVPWFNLLDGNSNIHCTIDQLVAYRFPGQIAVNAIVDEGRNMVQLDVVPNTPQKRVLDNTVNLHVYADSNLPLFLAMDSPHIFKRVENINELIMYHPFSEFYGHVMAAPNHKKIGGAGMTSFASFIAHCEESLIRFPDKSLSIILCEPNFSAQELEHFESYNKKIGAAVKRAGLRMLQNALSDEKDKAAVSCYDVSNSGEIGLAVPVNFHEEDDEVIFHAVSEDAESVLATYVAKLSDAMLRDKISQMLTDDQRQRPEIMLLACNEQVANRYHVILSMGNPQSNTYIALRGIKDWFVKFFDSQVTSNKVPVSIAQMHPNTESEWTQLSCRPYFGTNEQNTISLPIIASSRDKSVTYRLTVDSFAVEVNVPLRSLVKPPTELPFNAAGLTAFNAMKKWLVETKEIYPYQEDGLSLTELVSRGEAQQTMPHYAHFVRQVDCIFFMAKYLRKLNIDSFYTLFLLNFSLLTTYDRNCPSKEFNNLLKNFIDNFVAQVVILNETDQYVFFKENELMRIVTIDKKQKKTWLHSYAIDAYRNFREQAEKQQKAHVAKEVFTSFITYFHNAAKAPKHHIESFLREIFYLFYDKNMFCDKNNFYYDKNKLARSLVNLPNEVRPFVNDLLLYLDARIKVNYFKLLHRCILERGHSELTNLLTKIVKKLDDKFPHSVENIYRELLVTLESDIKNKKTRMCYHLAQACLQANEAGKNSLVHLLQEILLEDFGVPLTFDTPVSLRELRGADDKADAINLLGDLGVQGYELMREAKDSSFASIAERLIANVQQQREGSSLLNRTKHAAANCVVDVLRKYDIHIPKKCATGQLKVYIFGAPEAKAEAASSVRRVKVN